MKSSKELKESRAAVIGQYDALKAKVAAEKRDYTSDEEVQLNGFVAEAEAFDPQIEAAEKREAFEAKNAAKTAARVAGTATTDKETEQARSSFSVTEFVRQASNGKLEGLYAEMHEEARKESLSCGSEVKGFGIPSAMLREKRSGEMLAGTTTAGGHAIATEKMGIIEYLENALVLKQLGADFWTGLTGNISWPREDSSVTAAFATEIATATKSSPTLEAISLSPNRLAAYMDLSKQLMLQTSPNIEARLRARLGNALARGIETAAINGSGTAPVPRGILNTSGIGSVALGTNGLAPTFAMLNGLVKEIDVDNALMGNLGFLGNAKTTYAFKTTPKIGSTYPEYLMGENGSSLVGYGYASTNAVPSNLDKGSSSGVCSALIFGNWSDLVIGQWGGLDVEVNPYTKMKEGIVELVCSAYVDVEVLRPQSFAACVDILTA